MLQTLVKNKTLINFCQVLNLKLKNQSDYSVSRSSQKFSYQSTNSCNEDWLMVELATKKPREMIQFKDMLRTFFPISHYSSLLF